MTDRETNARDHYKNSLRFGQSNGLNGCSLLIFDIWFGVKLVKVEIGAHVEQENDTSLSQDPGLHRRLFQAAMYSSGVIMEFVDDVATHNQEATAAHRLIG